MSAAADWSTGALDGWLFGCLLYSIWNWRQLKLQDPKVIYSNRQSSSSISGFEKSQLKNLTQFPATLKEEYPKMLSASGRARWSCERFLESNYFRDSAFVQACLFLEHLTIKDSFEKDKFFRALPKLLDEEMPLQYARTKVLPHLMTALDVGAGANASVLAPIIKIAQGMTSDSSSSSSSSSYALDTTRSKLQASFLKWFQSPDRVLRIALLQQLPAIIGYLDNDSVSRDVFPSVAQGFLDTSPQLRELTVKSMLVFAPRLSEKLRNNELLKYLARLQVDAEAGIRTNTTIAIGKLAPYLTPAVRDKVLIPAFTRALHDTFPPARRAAIIALQATHRPQPSSSSSSSEPQLDRSCYSVPDIAGKLIPAVSPLTLDEDQTVRRSAMDCLLAFVDTLSTAQTALDKAQQANTTTATHSVAASTSSAHASSSVVNSGGDGGDASNGSTVLGWASKWWSGPGQPPSPNTPTSASSTSMSSPSSPTSFAGRATPPISHEAPSQYSSTSQTSTATPTATYSSSSRTGSTSSKGGGMKLAAKSTTNHNAGWGSGDGWGDGDDHEDDEVGSVWGADTASTKPAYAGDDNDDSGWGDSDFSVTPTTVSRLEQKNPHRSNSGW
jgi:SCY1-like protein 1